MARGKKGKGGKSKKQAKGKGKFGFRRRKRVKKAKTSHGPMYTVPFRRKREGKTDYRLREKLLKSKKTRVAIRKSNKHVIVQFIESRLGGDLTHVQVKSVNLKKYGWNVATSNLPAAYLTGYLAGLLAKKNGINEAIFDIGLNTRVYGTRIYAALKGVIDAGVDVPHDPVIFPAEERIKGEHVAKYAELLKKEDKDKYNRQFGLYLKQKVKPEKLPDLFEKTLSAIKKSVA